MEVIFLETVHYNLPKFIGYVTIISMHLPMKQLFKWMHEYRENSKIVVGDGGRFVKKCVLEIFEIA